MLYNSWNIARRELGAIYVQPIAYVFAIAMSLITGVFFSFQLSFQVFQGSVPADVRDILNLFAFLLLFTTPAITMRTMSEEQKSGTIEVLMTLPVRDSEVVLGKFLATFIFYASVTALTLVYPAILLNFGNPDVGILASSYLGVLLYGGALLSIGVFASTLSENQVNAFMLSFGLIMILFVTGIIAQFFSPPPWLATALDEMSFQAHLDNFLGGLIAATDVLYYLAIMAISLFAATRVLESRRWR